jgi:hypothetical protein
MQFAMQYYMFAQKHLTNKALTLDSYLTKQRAHVEELNELKNVKKMKLRKHKYINKKLDEQAIHFEVMIQKLRPDILEKRMKAMQEQGPRKDVRLMDETEDKNLVKNILKEQGILKGGQDTIVYEKVAFAGRPNKENVAANY